MKPIEETHPSLKGRGKWIENLNDSVNLGDNWYQELIIQKHTIDKQIVRDIIVNRINKFLKLGHKGYTVSELKSLLKEMGC